MSVYISLRRQARAVPAESLRCRGQNDYDAAASRGQIERQIEVQMGGRAVCAKSRGWRHAAVVFSCKTISKKNNCTGDTERHCENELPQAGKRLQLV